MSKINNMPSKAELYGSNYLVVIYTGRQCTMKSSNTSYGVSASSSLAEDVQTMVDINTTVPKVLSGDYENIKGASLWNVLDNICLLAEIDNVLNVTNDRFDTTALAEKYKNTHWTLCDHLPVLANEEYEVIINE